MKRPRRRRISTAPTRDGDTEQRILYAAHVVFLHRGTAGARMQDIASQAGVNQALLHYYFRSKDRLSEAVFRRAAAQLTIFDRQEQRADLLRYTEQQRQGRAESGLTPL